MGWGAKTGISVLRPQANRQPVPVGINILAENRLGRVGNRIVAVGQPAEERIGIVGRKDRVIEDPGCPSAFDVDASGRHGLRQQGTARAPAAAPQAAAWSTNAAYDLKEAGPRTFIEIAKNGVVGLFDLCRRSEAPV